MKPLKKKHLRPWRDGGVKSRKMWMSVGAAGMILIGAIIAALSPAFAVNYEVFVGGQIAALLAYCGTNVGAKAVMKHTMKVEPEEEAVAE